MAGGPPTLWGAPRQSPRTPASLGPPLCSLQPGRIGPGWRRGCWSQRGGAASPRHRLCSSAFAPGPRSAARLHPPGSPKTAGATMPQAGAIAGGQPQHRAPAEHPTSQATAGAGMEKLRERPLPPQGGRRVRPRGAAEHPRDGAASVPGAVGTPQGCVSVPGPPGLRSALGSIPQQPRHRPPTTSAAGGRGLADPLRGARFGGEHRDHPAPAPLTYRHRPRCEGAGSGAGRGERLRGNRGYRAIRQGYGEKRNNSAQRSKR